MEYHQNYDINFNKDLLQLWMTDKTLMEERRPYKNIDNNAYNNIKG